MILPRVEVHWMDAWSNANSKFDPVLSEDGIGMVTLGYCLQDDSRGVTVAQTWNEQGECSGVWYIPRGWIVKQRYL